MDLNKELQLLYDLLNFFMKVDLDSSVIESRGFIGSLLLELSRFSEERAEVKLKDEISWVINELSRRAPRGYFFERGDDGSYGYHEIPDFSDTLSSDRRQRMEEQWADQDGNDAEFDQSAEERRRQ